LHRIRKNRAVGPRMPRTNRVAVLIFCAISLPVAAQTAAGGATNFAVPRSGAVAQCGSLVLLRCDRPPPLAQSANAGNGLDRTRTDLFLASVVAADAELGRVVIFGERQKWRAQLLHELLQAAAPPVQAMTFRTTENFDGTRCTCASAPCVLNCCVCSRTSSSSFAH